MIAAGIARRAIDGKAACLRERQNLLVETCSAFAGRLEELGAHFGWDRLRAMLDAASRRYAPAASSGAVDADPHERSSLVVRVDVSVDGIRVARTRDECHE